jgi:hypothetical protein
LAQPKHLAQNIWARTKTGMLGKNMLGAISASLLL